MHSRRLFVQILPLSGLATLAACSDKAAQPPTAAAPAAAPAPSPAAPPTAAVATATPATAPGPLVDPADPTAVALGYVADAKTTQNAKHTPGAACANCALFGAKPGDASGPCPLFAGKQVLATAWCTAYTKKA